MVSYNDLQKLGLLTEYKKYSVAKSEGKKFNPSQKLKKYLEDNRLLLTPVYGVRRASTKYSE